MSKAIKSIETTVALVAIVVLAAAASQASAASPPVIEWQTSLGGTDVDGAYSIQQTSDGGYVVAGGTDSKDGDAAGNHGENDMLVVKLSPDGQAEGADSGN